MNPNYKSELIKLYTDNYYKDHDNFLIYVELIMKTYNRTVEDIYSDAIDLGLVEKDLWS